MQAPEDTNEQQFRVVELFAGVGGFALGLTKRLADVAFAVSESEHSGWQWTEPGPWTVEWANQWEPSTRRQHAAEAYRSAPTDHADVVVDADIHTILDYWLADESERDPAPLRAHALEHHIRRRAADREEEADRKVEGWLEIPLPSKFELLVGGFPCQDYSVAKTLSQSQGLVGKKGVLWWEIERIVANRRPPHVLLENVDRLLSSPATARGRDFATMLATFAFHGYSVEWRIIDASEYGMPQRRRRVFIYATLDGLPESPDDALRDGLFAESFPAEAADGPRWEGPDLTAFATAADEARADGPAPSADLHRLLLDMEKHWDPPRARPWGNSGAMVGGRTLARKTTTPPDERNRGLGPSTLGSIERRLEEIVKDERLHEYLIPTAQLRSDIYDRSPLSNLTPKERATWGYHKGAKKEERKRHDGSDPYTYTEGRIAFPDRRDAPSRTIVTGEGGRSVSRFKHVIAQPVDDEALLNSQLMIGDTPLITFLVACSDDGEGGCGACGGSDTGHHVFRRLTPLELERLNMFPDNWTKSIESDSRRAFTMGNALVVGIVSRLGLTLHERITRTQP